MLTRLTGKVGQVVPAFTANMFAVATNRTNKIKQGKMARLLSSLPK
jgi:hypothetical protein